MINIFVDTNFFMQHIKYDNLPWRDLFNDDISIIIPRTVVGEMDKHKNSNNKRLSKRAKNFVPLLRELRDGEKLVITNGNSISISILKRFSSNCPKKDFLNLSDPDDCIVNEILNWVEENPHSEYCFLSGDMKITLTCADCSIPYRDIPESWRLPEEADEKDKELESLKKQISRSPNIKIKTTEEILIVNVPEYKQLNKEQLDCLCSQLYDAFPEEIEFDTHPSSRKNAHNIRVVSSEIWGESWIYPTEKEIEKYQAEYRDWKNRIQIALSQIHKHVKNEVTRFHVEVRIVNEGSAPAENVELQIKTTGNILLLPPSDKRRGWPWGHEKLGIPLPPKVPEKRRAVTVEHAEPLDTLSDLLAPSMAKERKVNELYWKKYPGEPCALWEMACIELRHQMGSCCADIALLLPERGYDKDVAVQLIVSAKNISEPIIKRIPIRPQKTEGDLFSRLILGVEGFIKKYKKPESQAGRFYLPALVPRLFRNDDDDMPEIF